MKKIFFISLIFSATLWSLLGGCRKKFNYSFENGWDSLGIDTTSLIDTGNYMVDKSLYDEARIFPGLVGDAQPRLQDTVISIDLSKMYLPPTTLGVSNTPKGFFSTGLYAAPGELVRITVPTGVNGLSIQIGSQMDNLTNVSSRRRDPIIYTVQQLFPGYNYIRNGYGGYIWIKSDLSLSQSVALEFKDVVRAPDFVLGKTNLQSWKQEVLNSTVPWLELRSQHAAFSLPLSFVQEAVNSNNMDSVESLLKEWDNEISSDIYGWMGFTDTSTSIKNRAPEFPERFVMDIQPLDSTIHGGQPVVAQMNSFWFDQWTNVNLLKNSYDTSITFNEVLKNYIPIINIWWSSLPQKVISDLFSFKSAKRNGSVPPLIPGGSVADTITKYVDSATGYNGVLGRNFNSDAAFSGTIVKTIPFLQLFDKITNPATGQDGWSFFSYLYTKSRTLTVASTDIGKEDFFYQTLCEYTRKDMSPFLRAWGIAMSTGAQSQMAQKYPLLDKAIWQYNPITKQGGTAAAPKRKYLDRVNWTISANTESNSDGAANTVWAMLDGDPTTFWHSCWSGCAVGTPNAPLPYIIVVDMQQPYQASGFYVASRMGSRRVQTVVLSVSTDGNTWINNVDTFHLQNIDNDQYFNLPQPMTFRYFKFTLPDPSFDSSPSSPLNAISEIGAYDNGN